MRLFAAVVSSSWCSRANHWSSFRRAWASALLLFPLCAVTVDSVCWCTVLWARGIIVRLLDVVSREDVNVLLHTAVTFSGELCFVSVLVCGCVVRCGAW